LTVVAQIIVNFHIGYYDEYGNLIDSPRLARRRYLHRVDGFLLDLLSVFPLELVPSIVHLSTEAHDLIHHLMLFHMIRFIHIKRFFKSLQAKINIKYCLLPRFYRATLKRQSAVCANAV